MGTNNRQGWELVAQVPDIAQARVFHIEASSLRAISGDAFA